MMIHHLERAAAFANEAARVVRSGGEILIRNATKEDLDEHFVFDCFPQAYEIERMRLPHLSEIVRLFENAGLTTRLARGVNQPSARTYKEYCDRIATRSVSAFHLIPDDDFRRGVERLRLRYATKKGNVTESVSFLVFKKP